MTTYAIGDVQGCFTDLRALLAKINFNPDQDTLWFAGDLVNRGSQSLEVLRFVKDLGDKHKIVLGNHDLHLLAVAYGAKKTQRTDTLEAILAAEDCQSLMNWLCQQPLLYHDVNTDYVLVHAGLAPQWSLPQAKQLAKEVEHALQQDPPSFFLQEMYGNEPDYWDDHLTGIERLRSIVNYLTRMRFCYADGRLNFTYKGNLAEKPPELIPWFLMKNRANQTNKIIFGHWAALGGKTSVANLYPLDTGCIWGNCLTAMRIEDGKRFAVNCA